MSKNIKKSTIAKSVSTGRVAQVASRGGVYSVTPERASKAENAVREFYKKHGGAMTTLAYE